MQIRAVDLANVSGKSQAFISAETKRGKLSRNELRKYELTDSANRIWLTAHGLTISDFQNGKKLGKTKSKTKEVGRSKPDRKQTKRGGKTEKQRKNIAKAEAKSLSKKRPESLSPMEFEELIGLPGKLKGMTLEEFVLQHSNYPGMKAYAELLDKIMSGVKKSVEIQKIKHELIERNFFRSHVKSYLDVLSEQLFDYCGANKGMLKDFTKMIQHAQRNIDRELGKLQKIQELASGK